MRVLDGALGPGWQLLLEPAGIVWRDRGVALAQPLSGTLSVALPPERAVNEVTEFDDVLYGGSGPEFLDGLGGNDTVYGGGGDDTLGGFLGSDTLYGGDGNDVLDTTGAVNCWFFGDGGNDKLSMRFDGHAARLYGGAGDDAFDLGFYWEPGRAGTQSLVDGDFGGTTAGAGFDTLMLPGIVQDYRFIVFLNADPTLTTTRIVYAPGGGPVVYTFNTVNLEKVTINGWSFPEADHIPVPVVSTDQTIRIYMEIARLAAEAYLDPDDEGISVYDAPTHFAATSAAVARHWHPIAALELGLAPRDYGAASALHYAFTDGYYMGRSTVTGGEAMVLRGIVDGVDTVVLAFSGTDDFLEDAGTYDDFAQYLALFQPLLDALHAYLAEHDDIQLIVTGHSLGAAAASLVVADGLVVPYYRAELFTFGSPGIEFAGRTDYEGVRMFNLVHAGDPVTWVGGDAGTLLELRAIQEWQRSGHDSTPFLPKYRPGQDLRVLIPGDSIDLLPGGDSLLPQHAMGAYLQSLQRLVDFATDTTSPLYNLDFLVDVRWGKPYDGYIDVTLQLGTASADHLSEQAENQIIYAGAGDDTITLTSLTEAKWTVDGGAGTHDLLVITDPFATPATIKVTGIGNGGYQLTNLSNPNYPLLGDFYRVEHILMIGYSIRNINGTALVGQTVSLGANSDAANGVFNVNPAALFADVGAGAMTVNGTADADIIFLGPGAKTVNAGAGADIVSAKGAVAGAFTLYGGGGDDVLAGSTSADFLYGGADDDRLDGGKGADVMGGSAGNDIYVVDNAGDVVSEGANAGDDAVESTLSYVLGANIENLQLVGDYWTDLEGTGNALDNAISGTVANNRLQGLGGADVPAGGFGDDTLFGGLGDDVLLGGFGDDTIMFDAGADTQDGGFDIDTIKTSGAFATGTVFDLEAGTYRAGLIVEAWLNFENYDGSAGTGHETVRGAHGASLLIHGAGNGILYGGLGRDTVYGGAGADQLYGDTEDDYLNGGAGGGDRGDALYGGGGNDTLQDTSADRSDTFYGGAGYDSIYAGGAGDLIYGDGDIDFVQAGAGGDTVYGGTGADGLLGEAGNDRLYGGTDGDSIYGGADNDTLYGDDAADYLFGDIGTDALYGGNGADVLNGFNQNDQLYGGAGSDWFTFQVNCGVDTIQDWQDSGANQDVIMISHAIFATCAAIQAHMTQFNATTVLINAGGSAAIYLVGATAVAALGADDFHIF